MRPSLCSGVHREVERIERANLYCVRVCGQGNRGLRVGGSGSGWGSREALARLASARILIKIAVGIGETRNSYCCYRPSEVVKRMHVSRELGGGKGVPADCRCAGTDGGGRDRDVSVCAESISGACTDNEGVS